MKTKLLHRSRRPLGDAQTLDGVRRHLAAGRAAADTIDSTGVRDRVVSDPHRALRVRLARS
jgi:hypothetical protein